jgi:Flp pilus assembly protein TadG
MGLRKGLRAFIVAEAGVTAVEFAIIAPVLLLLLMGILEFALIMLAANVLESATTISARLGSTGFATGGGISRQQTILNSIDAHAGTLLNVNNVTITSESYTQYDQIGQPEPYTDTNHNGQYDPGEPYVDVNGNGQWDADMGTAGLGNSGDIVVYTVSYPWAIMTPIMSNLIGTGGIYTITTHAVVKNEPY